MMNDPASKAITRPALEQAVYIVHSEERLLWFGKLQHPCIEEMVVADGIEVEQVRFEPADIFVERIEEGELAFFFDDDPLKP